MFGRLWVAGCTLWPGRRGVRASVAQQPVSAAAGAASAGENGALVVVRRRGGWPPRPVFRTLHDAILWY